MLGDTGANHPDNWEGGLNSADLHAIIILFARDEAARLRSTEEHQAYLAQFSGVRRLSYLDVAAVAPFTYAHDHFGYRDQSLSWPLKAVALSQHRDREPLSNRVNSSSAMWTRRGYCPICRNRKSSPEMAASWPIVACRSISADSESSYSNMARPRRDRN
jgi:hypothetical protein